MHFLNVLVVLQFTHLSDCKFHCLIILFLNKYSGVVAITLAVLPTPSPELGLLWRECVIQGEIYRLLGHSFCALGVRKAVRTARNNTCRPTVEQFNNGRLHFLDSSFAGSIGDFTFCLRTTSYNQCRSKN